VEEEQEEDEMEEDVDEFDEFEDEFEEEEEPMNGALNVESEAQFEQVESPIVQAPIEDGTLFEDSRMESPSRLSESPTLSLIPPELSSEDEIARKSKLISEIESLQTRIQQQESTLLSQKNPILKSRA
jgi:hypothetical protein